MDRLIYTALSGMRANLEQQSITAHNIANASTPGFRRDISTRESLALSATNFASRIQAATQSIGIDNAPGEADATGRNLDINLGQDSYLAVQAGNGEEAYTRRGDLRAGVTGLLETGDGHPVIGTNGPISIPTAAQVEVGSDGTITVQPKGAATSERITVGQLKLVSAPPESLRKGADNLLRSTEAPVLSQDRSARVSSGMLEGSNVNMASEMIDLLEEARRYEIQVNLLTTAKDMDQSSAALLQIQNA